jgi:hypothetical protein
MSTNTNINYDPEDEDDEIVENLRDNIGRVITVFTQSGGCSGRGFTGLLVKVDCHFIKLTTSLPSAPRHPFGRNFDIDDFEFGSSRRSFERSRFGTSIVIPIRKIVSFVFNEQ